MVVGGVARKGAKAQREQLERLLLLVPLAVLPRSTRRTGNNVFLLHRALRGNAANGILESKVLYILNLATCFL